MTLDYHLKCFKEELCKGPNPAVSCHQSDNISCQKCIFKACLVRGSCNYASVAHKSQKYSSMQKIIPVAQELADLLLLSLLTIRLILGSSFQPVCIHLLKSLLQQNSKLCSYVLIDRIIYSSNVLSPQIIRTNRLNLT